MTSSDTADETIQICYLKYQLKQIIQVVPDIICLKLSYIIKIIV